MSATHEHVQYPAHVEPISTDAETVQVDKWFRQDAEPVRIAPRVITEGHAGVLETDFAAVVPELDSWHGQATDPIRRRSFLPPQSVEPPKDAELDSWHRPTVEPVSRRFFLPAQSAEPPKDADYDSWHRPTEGPVNRVFRQQPDAPTGPLEESLFLTPIFDWIPRLSEPVRQKPPMPPTWFDGILNESLYVTITVPDFFIGQTSEPIRLAAIPITAGLVFVTVVSPTPATDEPGDDSAERPTIREGGTIPVKINLSADLDEGDKIVSASVTEIATVDLTFLAVNPIADGKSVLGHTVEGGRGVQFYLSGHLASTGTYRLKITFDTANGITNKSPREDFVFDVVS